MLLTVGCCRPRFILQEGWRRAEICYEQQHAQPTCPHGEKDSISTAITTCLLYPATKIQRKIQNPAKIRYSHTSVSSDNPFPSIKPPIPSPSSLSPFIPPSLLRLLCPALHQDIYLSLPNSSPTPPPKTKTLPNALSSQCIASKTPHPNNPRDEFRPSVQKY